MITPGQSTQLGSANPAPGGPTALTGAGTFTDICDIYANQGLPDGSNPGLPDGTGGFLDMWVLVYAGVACSLRMYAPRMERTEGEEIRAVGVYDISLPTSTVIEPANRIVCNGITYEVQQRGSHISNQTAIIVRALRIN